ncbi:MAG: OmpA family protein [Deltaproteobacteria bacterium]|nr:OmpA family protein [Deltaproteobacteria bacterium]
MSEGIVITSAALIVGLFAAPAHAMGPGADARGEVVVDDGGQGEPEPANAKPAARRRRSADRGDVKWIRRWAPERNMAELGVFGGILLPSRRLELFEADTSLPLQGFKTFNRVAPDVGVRLGFYPSRFFGVDGEAAVMPTVTQDDFSAALWAMRLSFVGQLGLWSVTPFIAAGGGMLNVSSDRSAVGSDIDAALHFGGGLKVFVARSTQLRLDVRDIITAGQGVDDGVIHSPEITLGFSITLGRERTRPPQDTDGDGIIDTQDECLDVPGVPEYRGCPVPDTDGDTFVDPDDRCVDVPGVAEYEGCPIPDTDGDGILDPVDVCPDVPGVPDFKGCPVPDTDGDGILDPDDRCLDVPENVNGFEDADGCPDEIPDEIARFNGVIRGIYFDTNKDLIKPKSERILNEALEVLEKFSDVRLEISGHTDSRGGRTHNVDLSLRRAESVRTWLVEHGIDASRLETRGSGPDEPIDSNRTKAGRAHNRRIEFKLLR